MRHALKLEVPTLAGVFKAEFRNGKLASLDFPRTAATSVSEWQKGPIVRTRGPGPARKLSQELSQYLAGRRTRFAAGVDLSRGTAFQRKVWRALQRIPFGQTRSYGEIAREIGKPRASRAVGAACGQNPVPVLVPCHRVLASGGKLGGFSAGLKWKKRLLAIECRTR